MPESKDRSLDYSQETWFIRDQEDESVNNLFQALNQNWKPITIKKAATLSKQQIQLFSTIESRDQKPSREMIDLANLPDNDFRKLIWQQTQKAQEAIDSWQTSPPKDLTIDYARQFTNNVTLPVELIFRLGYFADDRISEAIDIYNHTVEGLSNGLFMLFSVLDRYREQGQEGVEKAKGLTESIIKKFPDVADEIVNQTPQFLTFLENSLQNNPDELTLAQYPQLIYSLLLRSAKANRFMPINSCRIKSSTPDIMLVNNQFRLGLIFHNLVQNSMKHNPIATSKTGLRLFTWSGISLQNSIRIIFADNGRGFSNDMLEETYGTARALKKGETTNGTGLGLWIVNDYISKLKGSTRILNGDQAGIDHLGGVVVIDFPVLNG